MLTGGVKAWNSINDYGFTVDSNGILLKGDWDSEEMWYSDFTLIANKTSINLTPFKRLIITARSDLYKGSNGLSATGRVRIYKTDRKTLLKTTAVGSLWAGWLENSASTIDVSDINEQAFITIDYDYYVTHPTGGSLTIKKIEFLTT